MESYPDLTTFLKATTKVTPVATLSEEENSCAICHEELVDAAAEPPAPPQSPSSEDAATKPPVTPPPSSETPDQEHFAIQITDCGHIFGASCLQAWLSAAKTCPLCRKVLYERGEKNVVWEFYYFDE